jgi:hypothetical protein
VRRSSRAAATVATLGEPNVNFRHRFLIALLGPALLALSVAAPAAEQDLSVNARLLLSARNGDAAGIERSLQAGASPNARNRLAKPRSSSR